MQKYAESSAKQISQNNLNNNADKNGDITNVVTNFDYGREKAVYDKLVEQYVSLSTKASDASIDASYCNSIINTFSTPNNNINQILAKSNIQKEINDVNNKFSKLYKTTFSTISDYNHYLAMKNIMTVSGISITESLSKRLYLFLTFVVGFGFSLIIAIAIEMIKKMFFGATKGQNT